MERKGGGGLLSYAFTTNSNNVLHLGFYFVLTLIYGGGGLAPAEGTRPRR